MQKINNLGARINNRKHLLNVVNKVIESGFWVLGPECDRFEEMFANYIMVNHCIGVANGTDAIELALKAMQVPLGSQVATVANAGMYTTTSLLAVGLLPFFMDVSTETCCVTLNEVKRAIDAGVKAVVVTHLYGRSVPEIQEIADYCSQRNIRLLEDCAQAHGAEIKGKKIGSFGDVSTFSFYPTKNLGAFGDGGAILTNNDSIARRTRFLKQYGWSEKYKVEFAGARNSRLDEIQAAVLAELLPYLDEDNSKRRQIAKRYCENIRHSKIFLPDSEGKDYVAHLFVIQSNERDSLKAHLYENQIATEIHYPFPDYRQPIFSDRFSSVFLENTEKLTSRILTLPCYPEMSNSEVENVINAANSWQK